MNSSSSQTESTVKYIHFDITPVHGSNHGYEIEVFNGEHHIAFGRISCPHFPKQDELLSLFEGENWEAYFTLDVPDTYDGFPPVTDSAESEAIVIEFKLFLAEKRAEHRLYEAVNSPTTPTISQRQEIALDWGLPYNQQSFRRVGRAIDLVRQGAVHFASTDGFNDFYEVESGSEKDKRYGGIIGGDGECECCCPAFERNYHQCAVISGKCSHCKHTDAILVSELLDCVQIEDEIQADEFDCFDSFLATDLANWKLSQAQLNC